MSVDCSAFVGYGWVILKDKLLDILSVLPKEYEDFWEEDDVYRMNCYESNPEIFFGKRLYQKDLNELLDSDCEPNKKIGSWREEAYDIYDKYFTYVEIPEDPKFLIREEWW